MELDRSRISGPIPGEEPSGPWLRREGTYSAVQEAMRSDPGDPAYGIPEKRSDWEEVAGLCYEALTGKSKDVYLAASLLEALTHLHGARGIADGLWIISEIHERFWDDFHPRPRDGGADLDARINQIEALVTNFARVIDALPMNEGREVMTRLDWKYAGGKLPGGDASPWTAEHKEAAVRSSSWDFYDGAVRSLKESESELRRFDDLVDRLYGSGAPSLVEVKGQLAEAARLFESLLKQKGPSPYEERARTILEQTRCGFIDRKWLGEQVRKGVPVARLLKSVQGAVVDRANSVMPEEGWQDHLAACWARDEAYEQKTEAAPAPAPAVPAAGAPAAAAGAAAAPAAAGGGPVVAAPATGEPVAVILGGCAALRQSDPGNPLGYLISRQICWTELEGMDASGRPSAPPAGTRERCAAMFRAKQWSDLLELCEGTLETRTAGGWLDLHRYSVAAMGQIGQPYGKARIAIVQAVMRLILRHSWLREVVLADGQPAVDEITGNWIAAESGSVQEDAASVGGGGGDDDKRFERASGLLESDGLEAAIEHLQDEVRRAGAARERTLAVRDLARLCLKAKRGDLAAPLFRRIRDELHRRSLEDWEGPEFLGETLEGIYRSYTLVSKRSEEDSARMRAIVDELTQVDVGRRIRLDSNAT